MFQLTDLEIKLEASREVLNRERERQVKLGFIEAMYGENVRYGAKRESPEQPEPGGELEPEEDDDRPARMMPSIALFGNILPSAQRSSTNQKANGKAPAVAPLTDVNATKSGPRDHLAAVATLRQLGCGLTCADGLRCGYLPPKSEEIDYGTLMGRLCSHKTDCRACANGGKLKPKNTSWSWGYHRTKPLDGKEFKFAEAAGAGDVDGADGAACRVGYCAAQVMPPWQSKGKKIEEDTPWTPGCRRVYSPAGGPGTCNATLQQGGCVRSRACLCGLSEMAVAEVQKRIAADKEMVQQVRSTAQPFLSG